VSEELDVVGNAQAGGVFAGEPAGNRRGCRLGIELD
jgi:hypothetical protein